MRLPPLSLKARPAPFGTEVQRSTDLRQWPGNLFGDEGAAVGIAMKLADRTRPRRRTSAWLPAVGWVDQPAPEAHQPPACNRKPKQQFQNSAESCHASPRSRTRASELLRCEAAAVY